MKHPNRYDLPKGHREVGETELQTAIRELQEETGINGDDLEIDPTFRFEEVYYPTYKRFGKQKVEKKLVIFLGTLKKDKKLVLTEHKGFQWILFSDPPTSLQANTIDPLLKHVSRHLKALHEHE